jgi:hypothetical protein
MFLSFASLQAKSPHPKWNGPLILRMCSDIIRYFQVEKSGDAVQSVDRRYSCKGSMVCAVVNCSCLTSLITISREHAHIYVSVCSSIYQNRNRYLRADKIYVWGNTGSPKYRSDDIPISGRIIPSSNMEANFLNLWRDKIHWYLGVHMSAQHQM